MGWDEVKRSGELGGEEEMEERRLLSREHGDRDFSVTVASSSVWSLPFRVMKESTKEEKKLGREFLDIFL